MKDLLSTLVIKYLKGEYSDLEFFDVLNSKVDKGGLGLDSNKANSIVSQITSFKDSLIASGKSIDEVISSYLSSLAPKPPKPNIPEVVKNEKLLEKKPEPVLLEDLEIDHGYNNDKTPYRGDQNLVDKLYTDKHYTDLKTDEGLSLPFEKHIAYHQAQLKSSLKGEKIQNTLHNTPSTLQNSATPAVILSAVEGSPLDTTIHDTPSTLHNTPEIVKPVEKKVLPPELKKLVDQESLASVNAIDLPVRPVTPSRLNITKTAIKKESWFSRIFKKKPKTVVPLPPAPDVVAIKPNTRPRLDDIIYTQKVVGPIEELEGLKIIDFRRMSKEPKESIEKIIRRLDLLAQDSLALKSKGVEALKKSELYRAYSAIMSMSIMDGQSFDESLKKQDRLTKEEFEAIMELNKRLSY